MIACVSWRRGCDMAGNLGRRDRLREEGEWDRRLVAWLRVQPRIIDCAAIEARRRSGLQAAHAQTKSIEAIAEPNGRRLANAARLDAGLAHMDHALQERARGDDDGPAADFVPACGDHARYCAILDDEVLDRLLDHLKVRLREDRLLHMTAIELAVRLRARPLDSRTLGAVEHAELNTRPVDHAPHQPIERIDLADEMPFAEAANRRIAGHLADRLELCVTSAVRAPIRAAAAAASQPACPPPTTITSKTRVLML